jgi:serine/threonine protein kinase
MSNTSAAANHDSAAPAAAMGKYVPLARLGHGGMADVFLAVARGPVGFNKLSVVKRLRRPDDSSHLEMFIDEARLAARLNHPNIVHTYEVGEDNGRYFIAMEYLEGQALQELLPKLAAREEHLSEPLIALVAAQALKGMHHAHELVDFDGTQMSVVHRDISPHNIMITYGGEVKVLDFGIAKANMNSTHTETGVLKGKVRYMAPEQATGGDVDRRVDVFAFGVCLWEMLARRPLFQGDTIAILTKLINEDVPTVQSIRADVSPALEAIALKALRRNRDERYATADEMRVELEQYLRGKEDAASEKELARVMKDVFATTRENVRARVNAYLANLPVSPADEVSGSIRRFPQTDELPILVSDSQGSFSMPNAAVGPTAASRTGTTSVTSAAPKRMWPMIAGGVLLAAAAGFVALRPKPAPVAPAVASSVAPVPTTARLRLVTTPAGALIERNGRPLDYTPAQVTLEPGEQTLVISRDGFENETLRLDVKAGESIERTLTLQAKAAPAAAAPTTQHAPPPHAHGASAARAVPVSANKAASPAASAAPAPARVKVQLLDDDSQ